MFLTTFTLLAFNLLCGSARTETGRESDSRRADRTVTYEDLIESTQLVVDSTLDFAGLAVSPNGKYVAVETMKPSISRNRLTFRWAIVELEGTHKAIDVGASRDFELAQYREPQRPIWCNDSKAIIYTGKLNGTMQIWRSYIADSRQEQLTNEDLGVDQFALSDDGQRLIYTAKVRSAEASSLESESLRGFLYDKRFAPTISTSPIDNPPLSEPNPMIKAYDLAAGRETAVSAADRKKFEGIRLQTDIYHLRSSLWDSDGARRWYRRASHADAAVWLEDFTRRQGPPSLKPLTIVRSGLRSDDLRCSDTRCTGFFKGLWISDDGLTVFFLRFRGRYDYGAMGLYAWNTKNSIVKEVFHTEEFLEACSKLATHLVCSHETATAPASLALVDLHSGDIKDIFDPNPIFSHLQFGRVIPLTWYSEQGVEGYGRLVEPFGYTTGHRYPLVICQYRSQGFLRGGVGDECPIHVLAARGFAVLSVHRPDLWDVLANSSSEEEIERAEFKDFADRVRVAESLRAGITMINKMGIIDSERVGIHGFSDGSYTASYMIINYPKEFAAASVAGTWWNPITYYLSGPLLQTKMAWFGLAMPDNDEAKRTWMPISVALNAASIETPLLIQVADVELLPETQTVAELQARHKPVEMHVFPREYHAKVQPAHRYAAYKRNLQWFQFWLLNIRDSDPVDPDQYDRWEKMRKRAIPN